MILLLLILLHYLYAKGGLTSEVATIEAGSSDNLQFRLHAAPAGRPARLPRSYKVPRADTKYYIQNIKSCPVEGYYFKRQSAPNSLELRCHLCFCQGDGTAVCGLRENRRCDVESYHYHNVGKREKRMRRSPISFGELFFQDAAKEVFNKQSPEVCKPFESSFSEGCPPEDWCIGCTVCDCNANGRWDCRVLSFCGGDKDKKQIKQLNSRPKVVKSNQKNTLKSTNKKVTNQPISVANKSPMSKIVKRAPAPPKALSRSKNTIHKGSNSPKPLIFKKDVQTRKPITLIARKKAKGVTTHSPVSDQFTQDVVKKVVTAMQTLLRQQVTATIPEIVKIVQKKTMEMNAKNQKNKISTTPKRKVATINKKQYYRTATIGKIPSKNNKPSKTNYSTVTNKSTRKTIATSYLKPRSISNKKANTKLMESYRQKRNVVLVNELTTEMARPTEFETSINTSPGTYEEHTEYSLSNNTGTDVYYNYSTNPTFYDATNISELKYSTNTVDFITNKPLFLNYNETVLITTESLFNNIKPQKHNDTKRINVSLDKIANANDLKYMKWSQMKAYKEKEKEFRSHSNNTIMPLSSANDNMNYSTKLELATESKVKIHKYDVQRKLDKTPKRFNITRVVNTIACQPKHQNKIYTENSQISQEMKSLQSVFEKLLGGFQINNATKMRRKLNIVKYLNKFFKKLFIKTKQSNKTVDAGTMDNKYTINTLCATFGPCVLNKKNKELLRGKFEELNSETHLMMKCINIVKGLLRLLDFPITNNTKNNFSGSKHKSDIREDLQKLSIILKTQYTGPHHANKLSETQLTQIEYIKNNTRVIMQSIIRIANILNDVIDILTLKNNKLHREQKSNYLINNPGNSTKQKPLVMLKKILIKYNIVQNTFMKKMYEMLNKIHGQVTNGDTDDNKITSNTKKISDLRAAEQFSNNILRKIRKLKNIAEVLSSGSRKKRQAESNDDAMEYLLMIMEYLMKKQQSDIAPANDGIDLLIQAIQNAPDIKPITKKVRIYVPLQKDAITSDKNSSKATPDNSFSDSNTISKEYNFISIDDHEKYFNHAELDKKAVKEDIGTSFMRRNNSTEEKNRTLKLDSNSEKYTSAPYIMETKSKQKDEITIDNHVDNIGETEAVTGESAGHRKFEVFVADYEDDTDNVQVFNVTTYTPELLNKHNISLSITDDLKLSDMKMRQFKDGIINNAKVQFITKTTLQWIDSDEEEDKPGLVKSSIEMITGPRTEALTQPVTSKTSTKKSIEDISIFSKELDDENQKKLSKVNTDEVMFKKQMDLLNSLDYATGEPDDSDSKDVRYLNDAYDVI